MFTFEMHEAGGAKCLAPLGAPAKELFNILEPGIFFLCQILVAAGAKFWDLLQGKRTRTWPRVLRTFECLLIFSYTHVRVSHCDVVNCVCADYGDRLAVHGVCQDRPVPAQ